MPEEKRGPEARAAAVEEKAQRLLEEVVLTTEQDKERFQKAVAESDRARVAAEILALGREVSRGMAIQPNTIAMLDQRIREIDMLVSRQLDAILHAPEFQALESAWRGLHYLVHNTETTTTLRIRVLNVSKKDLMRDLERAVDFDQSSLWKMVVEREYGMLGGTPYGLLIGDYEFSKTPPDLGMLQKLAGVAAGAHAPFLSAASAQLFGLDSFEQLDQPRDLAKIFTTADYAQWRAFRESEDSRFVGLALPHVLMRLPYGKDSLPTEGFNYEEDVAGADSAKFLWGNAAYALATRITEAFSSFGWCVRVRGVEGGGLVQGLPTHTFRTDEGDVAMKCPTEIGISDRREGALSELGFIPLIHYKGENRAAFLSVCSSNKPKKYEDAADTANALLASQLQYTLAVCRFAHYLKVMMRDKIGRFMSREECKKFLESWIRNYVLEMDEAPESEKAKRPLREARIEVHEDPARPGAYHAVFYLKPHFQLDKFEGSLRLVAKLPEPQKK